LKDARISLKTKKIIFVVTKGKFLGHGISKEIILVGLARTKNITQNPFPYNTKSIQTFFEKTISCRFFINY
jgi:hypothetical protein